MTANGCPDLTGRTIADVRPMTTEEMEVEGWHGRAPLVLVLDSGTALYPSQDDEGNGPGCLFGLTKEGRPIAFYG